MRNTSIILIDDNRVITVQELRVKDVRNLLAGFTDLDKLDVTALFGPRFMEIAALVEPFIIFPEGESIDDLTGSELNQVIEAVKEVNAPFLVLAGLAPAVKEAEPTLTAPAVA